MKYCLALYLQDDKGLILDYKNHHKVNDIWLIMEKIFKLTGC